MTFHILKGQKQALAETPRSHRLYYVYAAQLAYGLGLSQSQCMLSLNVSIATCTILYIM